MSGLTHKQELFCEAYLGDAHGNATEAARMAGYKSPKQEGSRLLKNADIASRVRARVDAAAMTADEVLAELATIAKAEWREFIDIQYDLKGNVTGATLLLKDKIRALELIGKYHKLFAERHIHQGDSEAPPITIIEAVRPEVRDAASN